MVLRLTSYQYDFVLASQLVTVISGSTFWQLYESKLKVVVYSPDIQYSSPIGSKPVIAFSLSEYVLGLSHDICHSARGHHGKKFDSSSKVLIQKCLKAFKILWVKKTTVILYIQGRCYLKNNKMKKSSEKIRLNAYENTEDKPNLTTLILPPPTLIRLIVKYV
ncbi:hypothetical protein FF38_12622 [Lucilia cuprina]|uniref:Uncharacterized protein n=1 Tax=Lucilia cuprina TaxID=7375 RepID=A0A0L0BMY1_LUCCU|nr:hypothetical protein FF38_12622 [Lucilia cuprina]